jgi:hypothetical protein
MSLTKNKWHVVKDYDTGFVGVGCTVPWTCLGIADIHHDVPNIEDRVEVAELIASAPDLKKETQQQASTIKQLQARIGRLELASELFLESAESPCYCGESEYGCPHCDTAIKAQRIVDESPQQSLAHIQADAVEYLYKHYGVRTLNGRVIYGEAAKEYANQLRSQE